MLRSLVAAWCVLLLTACNPLSVAAVPSPPPTSDQHDEYLELPLSHLTIGLRQPAGWSLYHDAEHIVLTEKTTPLDYSGDLQGIVVHLWVTHIESQQTIVEILSDILLVADVGERAAFSPPQPFIWQSHESAYYLLNTNNTAVALVLVIRLPDTPYILAVNISAPWADYSRIRPLLPELFAGFSINHRPLGMEGLRHIPQELVLPTLPPRASPPEMTPETTEEGEG